MGVMDEVNVPNKPGKYVLGWRSNCQTQGCMTRDATGNCLECCESCWWMFNTFGNTCSGTSRKVWKEWKEWLSETLRTRFFPFLVFRSPVLDFFFFLRQSSGLSR